MRQQAWNAQRHYVTQKVNYSNPVITRRFAGFSVSPTNFDFVYIFVISQYSTAFFMSLNPVRHDDMTPISTNSANHSVGMFFSVTEMEGGVYCR